MPVNENQTDTKQQTTKPHPHWPEVEKARNDIKESFGFVPTFMDKFTDGALPGAWNEAKELRFSPTTALDPRLKALIALSVSSQIPCEMISYFETKSTLAQGLTTKEQAEAVTMAALIRHWSTVINGSQMDKAEFRQEVDQVMANIKKMMTEMSGNLPDEKMFLVMPTTASETYKDIENTLGFVPHFFRLFPKDGIPGAWSEFKGLQLNPHTSLTGKQKELIGLGVAAQIPCDYCIYFHRAAATLNGATEIELQEAISLSALTRHWSAIFNSPMIDQSVFRREADQMIAGTPQRSLH